MLAYAFLLVAIAFRFLPHAFGFTPILAALLYFIETKKGFALVCGDVGTGKTMLINSLLQQLPETVTPVLIANPYVSSQELLRYRRIGHRGKFDSLR